MSSDVPMESDERWRVPDNLVSNLPVNTPLHSLAYKELVALHGMHIYLMSSPRCVEFAALEIKARFTFMFKRTLE